MKTRNNNAMLDTFVKTCSTLIALCIFFLSWFCQFVIKPRANLVEGELEIIEWCKERLGFNGLEELWEKGARKVSNLLEDESETWMELHATAVRKINIAPTLDQSQLSIPCLERRARQNFVFFLKKIMKFSEQDALEDVAMRVSEDIVARGVGLYAAYTQRRAVFYVYSVSGKLDNIIVSMKGQSASRIETKERLGRLMVGYIASAKGTYFIFVSKNGWVAPGCPFEVFVDDPPPGYRGRFGASEWCDSDEDTSPGDMEPANSPEEIKIKQERKRSFSKIVQMILNGKRIFSLKKSEIPKIKIAESDGTAFSTWSSSGEFRQSRCRRRSFTFISSEGATFPLDFSSGEDSKFFDTFDNLDIFKNDHSDIWAVQADEDDSMITGSEYLVKSRENSEDILNYCCYSIESKSDNIKTIPGDFWSKQRDEESIVNNEEENLIKTLKEDNLKKIKQEPICNVSYSDDFKLNTLPSIDRQESASETSVSEKIIEVAITENFECTMKKDNRLLFGKRRCKSIMSLFELKDTKKGELRRTQSAFYHFTGVYKTTPGFQKTTRKVLVKIEEYCANKEQVKSNSTVKTLKNYWDNLRVKKENMPKKPTEIEKTGEVANMKFVFEQLAKQNAGQTSARRRAEETNAPNVFSTEECSSTHKKKKTKTERITGSLERDLRGLFEDMNHGIGMPGIPNRLALLASLRSIEDHSLCDKPLLSTKRSLDLRRRTRCRGTIPWDQFLSSY